MIKIFANDIRYFGKGASGGYYPLSGICVKNSLLENFCNANSLLPGGHTYACNPVGASVGSHVIKILLEEDIHQNVERMGGILLSLLKNLMHKYKNIVHVTGKGLLVGVYFSSIDVVKLTRISLRKGLILYPGGKGNDHVKYDHVKFTPPLIINLEEIHDLVNKFEWAFQEVLKG